MNKRIKTVWILSIATMGLILCGQAYWLINQYRYITDLQMEKLKSTCAAAFKEEQTLRTNMGKGKKKDGEKSRTTIKVNLSQVETITGGNKNCKTSLDYELNGKRKRVYLKGLGKSDGVDLSFRYLASENMKLDKHIMDSLLNDAGFDTTCNFRFYKSDRYMENPVYSVGGSHGNRLDVRFSSNPLMYEAVAFSIYINHNKVLSAMGWQLAGSAMLVLVLAFCLAYQVKTIIIQKRIDGIRHEFMKNMIYEMKQPPTSEPAEDEAIKLGETDFFYQFNELRHGTDKVIITSRQAEILRMLATRKNTLVSREELLTEIWGDDSYANSMALNVQITYLRRALKADSTVAIEAVIKKGYILKA